MSTTIIDILGHAGGTGSPPALFDAARKLGDVSSTAAQVRAGLTGTSPDRWIGEAADIFREKQSSELPSELQKVERSFSGAARAVGDYAAKLEAIQDDARRLARARDGALAEQAAARQRERNAATELTSAKRDAAAAADPAARAAADTRVSVGARTLSGARASTASAGAALEKIDSRAEGLRASLQVAADSARSALDDASKAGISNTFGSAFEKYVADPLSDAAVASAKAVGKFVAQSADVAVKSLAFVLDPSHENAEALAQSYSEWAESALPILEVVGAAILVATAVAVIVPGAQVAVLPLLAASRAVSATKFGLQATKLGADGYLHSRGKLEGGGTALVRDGVKLGFSAAGLVPGGAGAAAQTLAKHQASLSLAQKAGVAGHALGAHQGWVTRSVTALKAAELDDVIGTFLLDVGGHVVDNAPDSAIDGAFDAIVSTPPCQLGGPIIGPLNGLGQGPMSMLTTTVAPVDALVGAR